MKAEELEILFRAANDRIDAANAEEKIRVRQSVIDQAVLLAQSYKNKPELFDLWSEWVCFCAGKMIENGGIRGASRFLKDQGVEDPHGLGSMRKAQRLYKKVRQARFQKKAEKLSDPVARETGEPKDIPSARQKYSALETPMPSSPARESSPRRSALPACDR